MKKMMNEEVKIYKKIYNKLSKITTKMQLKVI